MVPAAIAVGLFVPRDRSSQVELDDVVERFRASSLTDTVGSTGASGLEPVTTAVPASSPSPSSDATTGTDPAVATLVEPGIYLYRTSGFESIDVMSGVTHDYPTETSITVTVDGCGVLLRWDALQERREEWRLCATPAGIELQQQSLQYHEFFEQQTPEIVMCDLPVTVVPLSDEPVEPVALTCTIEDRPWLPVWEVLEADTRVVDGETVNVRRVRMTIDNESSLYENYVADWMLAPNGLPIELTVLKQSKSESIAGDVVYNEQVHLELASLEPLR